MKLWKSQLKLICDRIDCLVVTSEVLYPVDVSVKIILQPRYFIFSSRRRLAGTLKKILTFLT